MQAFVAETFAANRFRLAADGAYEAARKMTKARAFVTVAALFLAFSSVVMVLWLGAQSVINHSMTGGALSQFVLFAVLGASSLGQISEVWSEVSQAAGAAARIGELLAARPRIVAPAHPLPLPSPARGEVAFECVSFAYSTRPDENVLEEVSFRVMPGEVVAIVGPSGAGKSTIFQLLERFYDPTRGVITLDGVDISKLDPKALRHDSRWSRRTRSSSAPASPTTSPTARRTHRGAKSSPPPAAPPPTGSSPLCRRATTRCSGSAA